MASNDTIVGTAKIGRWEYPVRKLGKGYVRNTKRDGLGEWTQVEESKVTLFDAERIPSPELVAALGRMTPSPKAEKKAAKKTAAPQRNKSTWELGDKCPKGHTLTEDTRYVMPSGRVQCRKCRADLRAQKG